MTSFAFRSLGMAVLLICALAACVREPAIPASPSPTVSPTESGPLQAEEVATPVVTGTVRAATPAPGTRVPADTRRPGATPTPIVLQPKSARVVLGKAYPFQLYTHCGFDFSVDFDGSFWDATGTRPSAIGNPIQKGMMTLVDARHARFGYDKGSINYTRHTGVKTIPYLCI